jgi:hypothetical protein
MSTIIVPRPDVTSEQVADALRLRLGPRYNVVPGVGANWNPVGNLRPGHPDTIVVGTGSNRFFRAQVRLSRRSAETILHVSPGGVSAVPRLTNRLWIVRKLRQALAGAPGLR